MCLLLEQMYDFFAGLRKINNRAKFLIFCFVNIIWHANNLVLLAMKMSNFDNKGFTPFRLQAPKNAIILRIRPSIHFFHGPWGTTQR